jgi:hypothetical protein
MGFLDFAREVTNMAKLAAATAAEKLGVDTPLIQSMIAVQARDRRLFVASYEPGDRVSTARLPDGTYVEGVVSDPIFKNGDRIGFFIDTDKLGRVELYAEGGWSYPGHRGQKDEAWSVFLEVTPRERSVTSASDLRDDAWDAANERCERGWRGQGESLRRCESRARYHVTLPDGVPVSAHGDEPWRVTATNLAIYLHVNRKPDRPRYAHMEIPLDKMARVAFGTTRVIGGQRTTLQIFPGVAIESLRYGSTPNVEHRVLRGIFFPFPDRRSHLLILHQADAATFIPTMRNLLTAVAVSTVG